MRSAGETTDQLGRGRIEVIDVGYRDAAASIDRDMTYLRTSSFDRIELSKLSNQSHITDRRIEVTSPD